MLKITEKNNKWTWNDSMWRCGGFESKEEAKSHHRDVERHISEYASGRRTVADWRREKE